MTGFLGRHIAPEMLALLLLEMVLAFALTCVVLLPAGTGPSALPLWAVDRALVIAGTVGFTSFALGSYRPEPFLRLRSLMLGTALGGVVAFPLAMAATWALGMRSDWLVGPDRLWPTKILALWIATLFAMRLLFLAAVRSKLFVRRVAMLGPPGAMAGTVAAIRSGRAGFFEVMPMPMPMPVPMPGRGAGSAAAMRRAGVRCVIASPAGIERLSAAMRQSFAAAGITLATEPAFWERHLKRIDVDHLPDGAPGGAAWGRQPGRVLALVNRVGDVGISLAFLVFTLPLMLLVALLIRLESEGPVLYRQERVGLGGRSFVLLKFRSMVRNAETAGPAWAQAGDPRVTRVGSFMRRTRIDELPQLLNVLRGEMSFIGPRPERPHFVEKLAAAIPHYRERTRVKPGLTGWAQVNYPYGASVADARAKLSYDLYYVRNRGPLLDLGILFATVRVILFQEGAR